MSYKIDGLHVGSKGVYTIQPTCEVPNRIMDLAMNIAKQLEEYGRMSVARVIVRCCESGHV